MRKENKTSIKDLRVYQTALSAENKTLSLTGQLDESQFDLANGLRRAATGTSQGIYESHRCYSFAVKIESLHQARREAEQAIGLLEKCEALGLGKTAGLQEEFTTVIKQCWGLIKWLRNRQQEKQIQDQTKSKDELATARG